METRGIHRRHLTPTSEGAQTYRSRLRFSAASIDHRRLQADTVHVYVAHRQTSSLSKFASLAIRCGDRLQVKSDKRDSRRSPALTITPVPSLIAAERYPRQVWQITGFFNSGLFNPATVEQEKGDLAMPSDKQNSSRKSTNDESTKLDSADEPGDDSQPYMKPWLEGYRNLSESEWRALAENSI